MRLEMKDIVMEFGPVRAVDHVDLTVEPGQIIGLLGENGAGKSTLMNVLAGVYAPVSGKILIDDEEVVMKDVRVANACGIRFIHQELNLINDLTIYENIDFDFQGRNYYNANSRAPSIEELKATAPTIVTEFGLGDGVMVEDEVWTIKQIKFRDNFIAEGHVGWMYWDWSNTGFGGAYDLLAAGGKSTTDFRAGAYAIHYYIDGSRKAHRGEEVILDAPVLFCNKGSGTIEWIPSRQATSIDVLRSMDGGKTWKTLLDGVTDDEGTPLLYAGVPTAGVWYP